jgi:hypothetical protein
MVGDKTLFKWPPSANVGIGGRASPQPKKSPQHRNVAVIFLFRFSTLIAEIYSRPSQTFGACSEPQTVRIKNEDGI